MKKQLWLQEINWRLNTNNVLYSSFWQYFIFSMFFPRNLLDMDTFSKSDPGRSLLSLRLFTMSIQTFSLCCGPMPEIVSTSQIPFAWHGTTLRLSVFNFLTSIMKSSARLSYRCAASISEHKHRGRSRRQYRGWGADKLRPRGLQVASQLGPVISKRTIDECDCADSQRESTLEEYNKLSWSDRIIWS